MNPFSFPLRSVLLFLGLLACSAAWGQPGQDAFLDTLFGDNRINAFVPGPFNLLGVGERGGQPYGIVYDNAAPTPDSTFSLTLSGAVGSFTHATPDVNGSVFYVLGSVVDTTVTPANEGVYVVAIDLQLNDTLWSQRLIPDSNTVTYLPLGIHLSASSQSLDVAVAAANPIFGGDNEIRFFGLDPTNGSVLNTQFSQTLYEAGQPIVARFDADTLQTWGKSPIQGIQLQPEIISWRLNNQGVITQVTSILDDNSDGSVDNLIPQSVVEHPITGNAVLGVSVSTNFSTAVNTGTLAAVVYDSDLGNIAQIDWSTLGLNNFQSEVRTLLPISGGGFIATIHTPDFNATPAGAGDQLVRLDEALNPLWVENLLLNPTSSRTTIETVAEFDGQLFLGGQYRGISLPDTIALYVQPIDTLNPVVVSACPNCLTPGDANNDLAVNVFDLLYIPAGLGSFGPSRFLQAVLPAGSIPVSQWTQDFSDGINYAAADFDGDGALAFQDSTIIAAAYVFDPNAVGNPDSTNTSAPILALVINDTLALGPGDTLAFSIQLGNAQQSASGVLGAAFSLRYPSVVIDTIELDLNGWLGTVNSGSAGQFVRSDSALQQLDYAAFRTDQQTTAGVGDIATGRIIITDNLDGKALLTQLPIKIIQSRVIGANAEPLPHRRTDGAITEPTGRTEVEQTYFGVYPNPARDVIQVRSSRSIESLTLIGLDGRVIRQTTQRQLNVQDLSAGCYVMHATFSTGQQQFQRIIIQR